MHGDTICLTARLGNGTCHTQCCGDTGEEQKLWSIESKTEIISSKLDTIIPALLPESWSIESKSEVISSKIDNFKILDAKESWSIESKCKVISSKIDSFKKIENQESWSIESKAEVISSKIDLLWPTQRAPISRTGIGILPSTITNNITITASGSYYLTADLDASHSITITANNVTLDLNGHYANNINLGTSNNCLLVNGFINNLNTIGNINQIYLKNCFIEETTVLGTEDYQANHIHVDQCTFTKVPTPTITIMGGPIYITNCTTAFVTITTSSDSFKSRIDQCSFYNLTLSGNRITLSNCRAQTFTFSACTDISIESCIAQATNTVLTKSGFILSGTINACVIDHCSAVDFVDHVGSDARFGGFDFSGITFSNGIIIKECIAENNSAFGFKIPTGFASEIVFISNISKHNGTTPAAAAGDTNYCTGDPTHTNPTTFTAPNGPGPIPYYQYTQVGALSNYNNLTLS
jgi:hypothetical protein